MKKIACIANMNNNMFCLVRYLRDAGYDARLFLVDELPHFLPGADAYNDDYKSYTSRLDWYDIGYWKISAEKIRKDLEGFDFIIGSDLVPAFLDKAKLTLDMFIPHGGDIFVHGFYKFSGFPPKRWEIGAKARSFAQRRGIRNSRYIVFEYTNEEIEYFLDKIKPRGKRIASNAIYLYLPQYTMENFKKQESYQKAMEVRGRYDLIIFHQCRHVWLPVREEYQYKGNDILFRAYAKFVKDHPESNCLLILFRYGWDFDESKKYIEDLGIQDKVLWLPTMQRRDLMVWLSIADLCVGELGKSFLAYGSVYEDLALEKPFIGYRRDELYLDRYKQLYPMVSTNDEGQIAATFHDFEQNRPKYLEMGRQAKEWMLEYAAERPLTQILNAIKSTIKD